MTDALHDAAADELMTPSEVGRRLHVHAQTVRRYMNQGELEYVQLGRYRLVSPDQLHAFIDARRRNELDAAG